MNLDINVLALLGIVLIFWIRNLNEMGNVYRLRLRVKRKEDQLALFHSYVLNLNTRLVELAREKDIAVTKGSERPPLIDEVGEQRHTLFRIFKTFGRDF